MTMIKGWRLSITSIHKSGRQSFDGTEHLRSNKDFDISQTLTVRHEQVDDFANGAYAESRVNEWSRDPDVVQLPLASRSFNVDATSKDNGTSVWRKTKARALRWQYHARCQWRHTRVRNEGVLFTPRVCSCLRSGRQWAKTSPSNSAGDLRIMEIRYLCSWIRLQGFRLSSIKVVCTWAMSLSSAKIEGSSSDIVSWVASTSDYDGVWLVSTNAGTGEGISVKGNTSVDLTRPGPLCILISLVKNIMAQSHMYKRESNPQDPEGDRPYVRLRPAGRLLDEPTNTYFEENWRRTLHSNNEKLM